MFRKLFIKKSDECPLTHIILENTKSYEHKNYTVITISNDKYLYLSRNNKYGQLYNYTDELSKYLNFEDNSFNYESVEKIKRKEFNKLSNPFSNFKLYIQNTHFICLSLLIISFIYFFIESCHDKICNYYKIISFILQIILLILYLKRYLKFLKIKQFFFNNEDIYNIKNEYAYFPKRFFNIDSFPFAFQINLIFFQILYIIIPSKCHCYIFDYEEKTYNCCDDKLECRIFYLFFPLTLVYLLFFILDSVNDSNIKKNYNSIIYNWETNPIMSIETSLKKEYKIAEIRTKKEDYYFYSWKNNNFKVERLTNLTYINIYQNPSGKICGKDSYGNDLFFPLDQECPINDIFISNINYNDFHNFTKLYLGNGIFLYYTNKNIKGKILIDLRASTSKGVQLNLNDTNEICFDIEETVFDSKKTCKKFSNFSKIKFYDKIDEWSYDDFLYSIFKQTYSLNKNIYLYAINYQGINSSSITKKTIFKNYTKKMEFLFRIFTAKFVISFLNISSFIIMTILLISQTNNKFAIIMSFFSILLFLFYLTSIIICLIYNIKYFQNFMNKINKDFKNKIVFIWNIIIIVYGVFILLLYFVIIKHTFELNIIDFLRDKYNNIIIKCKNCRCDIIEYIECSNCKKCRCDFMKCNKCNKCNCNIYKCFCDKKKQQKNIENNPNNKIDNNINNNNDNNLGKTKEDSKENIKSNDNLFKSLNKIEYPMKNDVENNKQTELSAPPAPIISTNKN